MTTNNSALQKIYDVLRHEKYHNRTNFSPISVPSLWVTPYNDCLILSIDRFEFYLKAIEKALSFPLPNNPKQRLMKGSVIYSMMIRASFTSPHGNEVMKDTGTFLKAISYLPVLESMGVNILYLLPIFSHSKRYKKGELGSPYAAKNWFTLESDLYDPITGPSIGLDQQFSAFVEACHRFGIRVIIDFVPRTCARDSDLLLEHPDWFYWIKKGNEASYIPPDLKALGPLTVASKSVQNTLYADSNVHSFLDQFVFDPKSMDEKKWMETLLYAKKHPGENSLEICERLTGLTVAKAFADVINDPQPAWEDITYLRLYLDHPVGSKVKKEHPPYLLFDVAKSSLNPGKIPNLALWDMISNVLPYYIQKFGINGARIDMGHALPDFLNHLIIDKARAIDPNFFFLSEEMNSNRFAHAKSLGYDAVVGTSFWMEKEIKTFKTHEWMYNTLQAPLPVFACGETHDTSRVSQEINGDSLNRLLLCLNFFVPNSVPMINSGQELHEIVPMNLGLGCKEEDRYLLPQNHPNYGRLALFDVFTFDYLRPAGKDTIEMLQKLTKIRHDLSHVLTRGTTFPVGFLHMREAGIGFGYQYLGDTVLVIGHTELVQEETLTLKMDAASSFVNWDEVTRVFSTHEGPLRYGMKENGDAWITLQGGEVVILQCNKKKDG